MQRSLIETIMGAVVLAVAAIFITFAYSAAGLKKVEGYTLTAEFDRVGSITEGSDVRLSGVKIGSVSAVTLDKKSYLANVEISIDNDVKIPVDSTASIASEGLLGGNYLELAAGSDEEMLQAGDPIEYTQGPVDIVQLLGKFVFSAGESNSK